jgi:release factor glutamine methyltransferase
MTIAEILKSASKKLKSTLDAEVLLCHVLDKPKEYIYSNPEKQIQSIQEKKYSQLVSRRQLGWPAAYLTGKKEFFGRQFKINRHVLVPRPETETLVEFVLEEIKSKHVLKILDIGTGSGNIIISLAKHLGSRHLYFASDVSKKSLAVAKKNAAIHKTHITFRTGNLLTPWKDQKFDIIIANLPYGWKQWKNNTSAETVGLKFEPKKALFTKNHGLFLIDKFLKQVNRNRPPLIFLEFDPRQTSSLKKIIMKYFPESEIEIFRDLAGKNRVAQIKTAPI